MFTSQVSSGKYEYEHRSLTPKEQYLHTLMNRLTVLVAQVAAFCGNKSNLENMLITKDVRQGLDIEPIFIQELTPQEEYNKSLQDMYKQLLEDTALSGIF